MSKENGNTRKHPGAEVSPERGHESAVKATRRESPLVVSVIDTRHQKGRESGTAKRASTSLPQITSTKRERFQAFRPGRTKASADTILAASQAIATEPGLPQKLIANPYTREAIQAYGRIASSDMSLGDMVKATILAEPKGAYERKFEGDREFQRLPWKEKMGKRKEAFLQEIDTTADMIVRLSTFTNQLHKDKNMGAAFLGLSAEQKFSLLSQKAFGTVDQQEIEEQFSQNQRRGIRLAIANFIDDTQMLASKWLQMCDDLPGAMTQLFNEAISGKVRGEFTPFGIIFTLEEDDYKKFEKSKSSNGHIRGDDSLPPELQGRIALINRDAPKSTRPHEMAHMKHEGFIEDAHIGGLEDREKVLAQIEKISAQVHEKGGGIEAELHMHRSLAQALVKQYMNRAKDETIAFIEGSGKGEFRYLDQLGGDYFLSTIEAIENSISSRENTTYADDAKVFGVYLDAFETYADKVQVYQLTIIVREGLSQKLLCKMLLQQL